MLAAQRYRILLVLTLALSCALGGVATACTIPVFRYALERWEADRLLAIVYYDGKLSAADDAALSALARRSSLSGGPLNIEVLRYDVASQSPPTWLGVQPPADRPLPWVEIRPRNGSTQRTARWEGPLADAIGQQTIYDSPARREIARRIFEGHSAVWLLITPPGQEQALSEPLQAALDSVSKELVIPQGIGLPGSELYAPIPLAIRFSVLAIAHSDPAEQALLKQLSSAATEWRTDSAYVIPVFGRLRALEVFPLEDADELLIRDVGEFLCGACSCQVKQANPGFDLLASVEWEQRLFGGSVPESVAAAVTASEAPQYLAIPSGDRLKGNAEPSAKAEKTQLPVGQQALSPVTRSQIGLLLAFVVLIGGGIVGAVVFRKRQAV